MTVSEVVDKWDKPVISAVLAWSISDVVDQLLRCFFELNSTACRFISPFIVTKTVRIDVVAVLPANEVRRNAYLLIKI